MRNGLGALCVLLLVLPAMADEEPLNVTLALFADLAVPITRSAPAEVRALAHARVSARLEAPVVAVLVEPGDRVAAGDPLVRLDCADFGDRLEQAEGRLAELEARSRLAGVRVERVRRLREQGAVSPDELDAAGAEVDVLDASRRSQRAALQAARRNVERCDVRAPFAGVVDARRVDQGDFVQHGRVLIDLLDPDRLEVRARLTGANAETLGPDSSPVFRSRGIDYPLSLLEVVPVEDPATRLREARFELVGQRPLPGTGGRILWRVSDRGVPADLVVRRDGRLGIMIADGDHARFLPLPAAIEGRAVVVEALDPQTRVIVNGRFAAADGRRLRTIDAVDGD